jgi:NAD(P)-dependent dehydrogenase (short-subunit alcohol dehydrogenase family)
MTGVQTSELSNDDQVKVAVVTGASQGIGAGLVAMFRSLGYAVVANFRSTAPSADDGVLTVRGDIADPATSARLVERALNEFGHIDTLVNNAGAFIAKPFEQYTEDDFELITGVNLRGFFTLTQRALTGMVQRRAGHIVTITTSLLDHALSSVPSALASPTKGGLNAATRSLAIEVAGRGVRVNAVSPGIIKTPMQPANTHDFFAELHPMGWMGEIAEVTDAVRYLETAQFVTGETLHVDGGQSDGH